MRQLARILAIGAVLLTATACFTYSGPRGVKDSLEQSLGVELTRDEGIKLGPISMRLVASFTGVSGDPDFDFHDLTSVGVAVFKRTGGTGSAPHRVDPKDLGLKGYSTMLSSSDGDEQVLIMVKPRGESIHEMVVLAVDADEVTVARLTGHLDKMLAKAIDDSKSGGAHGARSALPFTN
jgi:hypothetical protein